MLSSHIDDELIDWENNPEHQKVADYYLNKLLNDENAIELDYEDTVIITGYSHNPGLPDAISLHN